MEKKKYIAIKKNLSSKDFLAEELWEDIPDITIGTQSYLWANNTYKPITVIKVFHSESHIYLKFKVFEKKIKIKHLNFGTAVWKDSCVEFFINPFPKESNEYFNIEINAIGKALIGVGESGHDSKRYYFKEEEIKDWEIISSIKKPIDGKHGKDFWTLHYKIPKSFFEKYYDQPFKVNNGIANFYKCGDETEFEHFGAWNRIESHEPNFHLPEYFGEIKFEENI